MRVFWIAAVGLCCALSAAISAIWVALSIPAAEPGDLRAARQLLRADAASTRRLLTFSCARDVQVERLLLELSAGGGEEGAREVARALERSLGGSVALYVLRGTEARALAGAASRTRGLLERAARTRLLEDERDGTLLDACQREQSGTRLWLARSTRLPDLLAEGSLRSEGLALVAAADGSGREAVTFENERGARFALTGTRASSERPPWLLPALLCSAGAFLLGVLLALFWVQRGPDETVLATLEQAAERVAQGDLSSTIALRVQGRADQTLRSFDRMTAELRETRAKLLEAERAAAWQDMAQRVAHEIKNPLSPIKMGLETLRKAHAKGGPLFEEIFDESTRAMLEEVQRIEHIVREFREFARLPRARPGALDLGELVRDVTRLYAPSDIALELEIEEGLSAHADREQISQVIGNLLTNAIDAVAGVLAPRILVGAGRAGDGLLLRVDDNGPGVPESERARVFEPYVTGKQKGTGLGLAIARRIVQDHGGSLVVGQSPLGGARFEVRLPEAESSSSS